MTNFGQMIMWHIVLLPLCVVAIVGIHVLMVRLRGVVFRREWHARHPDYAWVSEEYDRLVEHYRSKGNLFARLAQVEDLPAVQLEIGHPS